MISFFAGLGLGLSLIIAIGAQNVFVLRQGIRREHVLVVVVICALSDAVLIATGVAGLGFLLERVPWLVDAARILGAVVLLVYGLLAARRAWRGADQTLQDAAPAKRTGRLTAVIALALALTWLNPHVYLDTVLMLGSIAATHGDGRWLFAAGAMLASVLWFTALGYGARGLARWLNTARAWRILDALIALVMIVIAVSLVLPLFE
ncbi:MULTISPECIES: LysE/ArgO family amino acid transporter [Microbacterium]|uniref:LysE/ArgO family amino acid transporter n=1 Tax=Microbacterium profundi TaxID=450380 RepID=A0ABV3LIE8_9MICO|nr:MULTISPECIES: LysE/ArgO family amino acid transporter [Microbacterium]MCE7481657.1 LysE/ArgO family amino acid transporter [Microbacterium profundi]